MMKTTYTLAALFLSAFLAIGCDNDGPMEDAGESIDDAASDVGNAVEDACEDIKDSADAEDQDC